MTYPPISDELVKRLKGNADFKEFRAYLEASVDELDRCSNIPDMADHGEEARGRAHAKKLIARIFEPFTKGEAPKETSAKDIALKRHALD